MTDEEMQMRTKLDTQFDEQLNTLENLNWFPWIGQDFSASKPKLLVVGESLYNYDNDAEIAAGDRQFARFFIYDHVFEDTNANQKLIRNTELAVFNSYPSEEQKKIFWANSGYYYFVHKFLKDGRNERPNNEDFSNGWDTFMKVVLILKPEYCLFCGVTSSTYGAAFEMALKENKFHGSTIEWKEKYGRVQSRVSSIEHANGYKTKLLFMRHPSSYFPWDKWANFLGKEAEELISKYR